MPATNGSSTSLSSQSTAANTSSAPSPENHLPFESHWCSKAMTDHTHAATGPQTPAYLPASAEFMWRIHSAT